MLGQFPSRTSSVPTLAGGGQCLRQSRSGPRSARPPLPRPARRRPPPAWGSCRLCTVPVGDRGAGLGHGQAGDAAGRDRPDRGARRPPRSPPSAPRRRSATASWLAARSAFRFSTWPSVVQAQTGQHRQVAAAQQRLQQGQIEADHVAHQAEVDRIGPGAGHHPRRAPARADHPAAGVQPHRGRPRAACRAAHSSTFSRPATTISITSRVARVGDPPAGHHLGRQAQLRGQRGHLRAPAVHDHQRRVARLQRASAWASSAPAPGPPARRRPA